MSQNIYGALRAHAFKAGTMAAYPIAVTICLWKPDYVARQESVS